MQGKPGIDRAELLGGDDHVDVGEPAAPVVRREHAECDPALVRVDVGPLRHLERAQRVGLGVGLAHDRREHVLREVPRLELQLPLLVREGEIDGHMASS